MIASDVHAMKAQMLEQQVRAESAERKLRTITRLLERAEAVDSRWVDGIVLAAILRQE